MALNFVAALNFFQAKKNAIASTLSYTGKIISLILCFDRSSHIMQSCIYAPHQSINLVFRKSNTFQISLLMQLSKCAVETFSYFSGVTPAWYKPTEGMYRYSQGFVIKVKVNRNTL